MCLGMRGWCTLRGYRGEVAGGKIDVGGGGREAVGDVEVGQAIGESKVA